MNLTIPKLCGEASVGVRTYYDALGGVKKPGKATLSRLAAALGRCQRKASDSGQLQALRDKAAWRCALVLAAAQLGQDGRLVLAADPARKATADPEWMAAAQVRRLAYWTANGMLGLSASDIGRLAGVTKQAVSKGIQEMEDTTDPAMRAARRHLEKVFSA